MTSLQLISFLLLAIPSGICGSISVWNGNVFFGHVFAHALLLPPSLCYFFGINSDGLIFLCSIIFGALFSAFFILIDKDNNARNGFPLLMFSLVTTGLSVLFAMKNNNADLESYVMGDIVFVTKWQIGLLACVALAYLIYLHKYGNIVALNAINADLAKLQNKHIYKIPLLEMLVRSVLVVLGARMFGILLISNSLIAPAMIVVGFSHSPRDMVIKATICAMLTSQIGLLIGLKQHSHPAAIIAVLYGLMAASAMTINYFRKQKHKHFFSA